MRFLGIPLELNAYYNILRTLGIGGYRDQQLAESQAVEYGDLHFTCFQFAYDWRRDLVESAQALDRFVKAKEVEVQQQIFKRFGVKRNSVKFDLVAHSMGRLVAARYYSVIYWADVIYAITYFIFILYVIAYTSI